MADALLLLSQFNAESLTPNVFSLVAARYLSRLMGDLFRLSHLSLGSQYPSLLAPTVAWSPEVYLVISCLVEASSLSSKASGFTEGFFGLKREGLYNISTAPSTAGSKGIVSALEAAVLAIRRSVGLGGRKGLVAVPHSEVGPMQRRHQIASLVELAIVPYVEAKLEASYAELTSDQPDTLLERRARMARLKADMRRSLLWRAAGTLYIVYMKLLVRFFPLLRAVWRLAEVLYLGRFAIGRSRFYTPLQHCASVVLRRATMEDRMGAQQQRPSVAGRVATAAGLALSGVFVALRVLEWSRRGGGGAAGGDAPSLGTAEDGEHAAAESGAVPFPRHCKAPKGAVAGQCVVCKQQVANPAVNIVSGAVGCYVCLQEYVAAHGQCPLTGVRSTSLHIRRLYEG